MAFTVCRSPFAVRKRSSSQALRTFRRANPLDEPRQHLFDIRCRTFQSLSLFWSKKSQILRQQNETNQFVGRTGGYVQELPEFSTGSSATSFRDIGGDGSRCSPHLAGQAESFGTRISSRRAIDTQRQSLPPLPYLQFPEVLHVLTPSCISEGTTLVHKYHTKQVPGRRVALTANGERQTANEFGELPC